MKEKIYFTDKILNRTVLFLVPRFIKPNHLTVLRFFLIPPVIWLFWSGHYIIGGILFLIAAFTDALDGSLARTKNEITTWGKIYDPIADKLLICSTVYILVLKYVDFYAAWVIIILEIIIVASAFIKKYFNHQAKIQSNIWGKIKMNLQVLGVFILLISIIFDFESLLQVSRGTFYLAIAFGILSLFSYGI